MKTMLLIAGVTFGTFGSAVAQEDKTNNMPDHAKMAPGEHDKMAPADHKKMGHGMGHGKQKDAMDKNMPMPNDSAPNGKTQP